MAVLLMVSPVFAGDIPQSGDIWRSYGWTEQATMETAKNCLTKAGVDFLEERQHTGHSLIVSLGDGNLSSLRATKANECLWEGKTGLGLPPR